MTILPSCRMIRRMLASGLIALLLVGGISPESMLLAQITVTSDVVSYGGGTMGSAGHTARGTISQTAVGRVARGGEDRHYAGFWYWAYRPDVTLHVSIPHLEAEVGTRLTVPLHLTISGTRTPFTARTFRARIRFNRTLLHPAGSTPRCAYDGGDCVLEITGVAQEGPIAELEFIVALGDSERTALTIEEFEVGQTREERIALVREHGALELLGVCREGGVVRLIHSGPPAARLRIWPNPAAGRTTIEYLSTVAGPVEIRFLDLLGNDVARPVSATVDAERLYRFEADLAGLPAGSYLVVYTTPSRTLTRQLLVTP